jgi:hypothetical protein
MALRICFQQSPSFLRSTARFTAPLLPPRQLQLSPLALLRLPHHLHHTAATLPHASECWMALKPSPLPPLVLMQLFLWPLVLS